MQEWPALEDRALEEPGGGRRDQLKPDTDRSRRLTGYRYLARIATKWLDDANNETLSAEQRHFT